MNLFQKWLIKSDRDLKSACKLLAGPESLPDTAIYHAQQSVEKALKGLLSYHNQPLNKTHDLVELINLASELNPEIRQFLEQAEILTPYSTVFRYPDMIMEPEESEVVEAIKIAEEILIFIQNLTQK